MVSVQLSVVSCQPRKKLPRTILTKIETRRLFALPLLLLLVTLTASCAPARYAIYSRPGGAEVYVDEQLIARTVNEVTPIKLEVPAGRHAIKVIRDGYEPWVRDVEAKRDVETPIMADLAALPPPPQYVPPLGSIDIRTEPGGARILLDGKEMGYTKPEAQTPVKIENLPPGKYIIRIERDGYQSSEERFEVYPNQATRAAIRLFPLLPYYCFPTNADLLRLTAMRAIRGVAYMSGMRSNRSIAVVNLAGDMDEDGGLRALVEDAIIAELAQKGRPVAERDDHLLVRIANEAARGDSLVLDVLTRHGGRNRPFLYDARLRTFADAAVLTIPGDSGPRRIVVHDLATPPEARIPTADQVLGYKIVEKTLRVDPIDDPAAVEPMVRREVILRLFVRLIDARTGIAQWAERFEASLTDHVPERVYRWLEKPPRQVYAYEMVSSRRGVSAPLPGISATDGSAASRDTTSEPVEYFMSDDLQRLNDADAVFWYHRNIGESYLRANRLEDAHRLLESAVQERPNDYDARMLYAETLLKSNRMEDAGREYVEALRRLTAAP